jgi:hypothetical protein
MNITMGNDTADQHWLDYAAEYAMPIFGSDHYTFMFRK